MGCSTPGLPGHHQLPELGQTHVHWVGDASNHLILCPLLLLPSVFLSIRVFSNESVLNIRWQKYWSFSFNISASNEQPGVTSFRMKWLDLLIVQRILKNLPQHHTSNISVLRHSPFFIVQLSHPYMIIGKIALGGGTMKNPSLYGVQVHIPLVKAAMTLTKNWWMQK